MCPSTLRGRHIDMRSGVCGDMETIPLLVLPLLTRCTGAFFAGSGTTPELQLSNTDVLVCARGGGGLLRERMTLVSALWAKHIRAELLHAASPSLTEQYQYASAHGVKWLVTLEEARLRSADMVTVKCLERRIEEHVAYPEARPTFVPPWSSSALICMHISTVFYPTVGPSL